MYKKQYKKRIHFIVGVALSLLVFAYTSQAQVMQSASYQIQSDSVNTGGVLSTSTNYTLEDTVGEIATGPSTSTTYSLKAGYQQMQETYLAMTAASNVNMSPSIPGVTGGIANGSTYVIVTTDNTAGYELSIMAEGDPALQSVGDSFENLNAGGSPRYAFALSTEGSAFGFTPEGADITDFFLDDGLSVCNLGSTDSVDACWDALKTTETVISGGTSSNHPTGATTTIKFRAESGSGHIQSPGTYTATTTLTAIAL